MTIRKNSQPRSPRASNSFPAPAKLGKFARRLLREWRLMGLPFAEANVVVAVSGGGDSVALLLALDELVKSNKLGLRITVAHLNHKLRGKHSDADARWVKSLAKQLDYPAVVGATDVKKLAASTSDNLEQAASRARYEFLERAAKSAKAGVVLTAHTLDDQAETILLNLLRGAGTEGLTAMAAIRPIAPRSKILLARPLLSWARRKETEGYCRDRGIAFRSDEMNLDESLARVRVRRQLIPLMETFNPRIVDSLTRTGAILRHDFEALSSAAARLLELSLASPSRERHPANSLRADLLILAPAALRRRALRLWLGSLRGNLKRIEHAHILAIENLLMSTKSGRVVELPDHSRVARQGGRLLHYQQKSAPQTRTRRRHPSY